MSVDLSLLPFECDEPNISYSQTVLACGRRPGLWKAILKLPAEPVPDGFNSYMAQVHGTRGYGRTTETPYGEPLLFVRAKALAELRNKEDVQKDWINSAVWAYLA